MIRLERPFRQARGLVFLNTFGRRNATSALALKGTLVRASYGILILARSARQYHLCHWPITS